MASAIFSRLRPVETAGAISALSTFCEPQAGQSTKPRLCCVSKSSLLRNQASNSWPWSQCRQSGSRRGSPERRLPRRPPPPRNSRAFFRLGIFLRAAREARVSISATIDAGLVMRRLRPRCGPTGRRSANGRRSRGRPHAARPARPRSSRRHSRWRGRAAAHASAPRRSGA